MGDGDAAVGAPCAGAEETLIRKGIDAINGNEAGGISGAGGIAKGKGVDAARGEIYVEINPFTIAQPAGNVTPAGEAGIKGFQADMMQGGVLRFETVGGNSSSWIGTELLGEPAEGDAGSVVLQFVNS